MTISDCNDLLTEQSRRERDKARERIRMTMGARRSDLNVILLKGIRRNDDPERFRHPQLDHFKCFTKNGQGFILDEPYGYWWVKDDEPFLKKGWRILYLPPQMSTYLVGITCPRLLAQPNSKIDLLYLLELLEIAQFRGNEVRCPVDRLIDGWKFDEIARYAEISKQLNILNQENPPHLAL